jgi:hypothetical protein
MNVIDFILLLLGAVCFAGAALGVGSAGARPVGLLPLGLFFWILVPLIAAAQHLQ